MFRLVIAGLLLAGCAAAPPPTVDGLNEEQYKAVHKFAMEHMDPSVVAFMCDVADRKPETMYRHAEESYDNPLAAEWVAESTLDFCNVQTDL